MQGFELDARTVCLQFIHVLGRLRISPAILVNSSAFLSRPFSKAFCWDCKWYSNCPEVAANLPLARCSSVVSADSGRF